MTPFSVFGRGFRPTCPHRKKNRNSVSIESECLRFLKFRENLIEIGLVDSEKLFTVMLIYLCYFI